MVWVVHTLSLISLSIYLLIQFLILARFPPLTSFVDVDTASICKYTVSDTARGVSPNSERTFICHVPSFWYSTSSKHSDMNILMNIYQTITMYHAWSSYLSMQKYFFLPYESISQLEEGIVSPFSWLNALHYAKFDVVDD